MKKINPAVPHKGMVKEIYATINAMSIPPQAIKNIDLLYENVVSYEMCIRDYSYEWASDCQRKLLHIIYDEEIQRLAIYKSYINYKEGIRNNYISVYKGEIYYIN